eukprot:GDKJ01004230.1.p1 GENE.GDKJ01004230.1~~GDKJ01004230.1.p1  ORF type:complete len:671 (+),score=150.67 GDKJ01004230.1:40-2052(+)
MFTSVVYHDLGKPLSRRDVTRLKYRVALSFNLNETEITTIFNDIVFSKAISSVSRSITSIILVNEVPIFIDSPQALIPTLYTLWKYPYMTKRLITMTETPSFVFKSVDLMLPGVLPPPYSEVSETDPVGTVFSVFCHENPNAFAVVVAHSSGTEMLTKWTSLVSQVWHVFGDTLWAMGPQTVPPGFSASGVLPIEGADSSSSESHEEESADEISSDESSDINLDDDEFAAFDDFDSPKGENIVKESSKKKTSTKLLQAKATVGAPGTCVPIPACFGAESFEAPTTEKDVEKNDKIETDCGLIDVLMDEYFLYSALEYLSNNTKVSTPVPLSAIVANLKNYSFVASTHSGLRSFWLNPSQVSPTAKPLKRLPSCDDEKPPVLDAKKSSFKKVGKLFTQHKTLSEIFKVKVVRGEDVVISIDFLHPAVSGYKPMKKQDVFRLLPPGTKTHLRVVGAQDATTATAASRKNKLLKIVKFAFSPVTPSLPLFRALFPDCTNRSLFSSAEVTKVAISFIEGKQKDRGTSEATESVPRNHYWVPPEIRSRVFVAGNKSRCWVAKSEWVSLFKETMVSNIIKEKPNYIHVSEMIKKGHKVTYLMNLSNIRWGYTGCAAILRRTLACACSVKNFKSKDFKSEECLQIQGHQGLAAARVLRKEFRVKKFLKVEFCESHEL